MHVVVHRGVGRQSVCREEFTAVNVDEVYVCVCREECCCKEYSCPLQLMFVTEVAPRPR